LGSHKSIGSENYKRHTVHAGREEISMLMDETIRISIAKGSFMYPENVAINEHDEPCYGIDNRYLINAPFHKFRGADKAYRFATLEFVKNSERLTLSIMKKHQLDGIENAMEIDCLLRHAIGLGIHINMVLMDRGYLDAGVIRTVESLKLEYIIPAKDNPKVLKYKKMEMKHYDSGLSFLVINDTISSGKESVETNFGHIVYYSDRKRHEDQEDKRHITRIDSNIVNNVIELCRERITYGYNRIWTVLRNSGIRIARKTVYKRHCHCIHTKTERN
jgi:hypothetical protein